MFYFGGLIVESSGINEETGRPNINPENVLVALFAIMFGASHAGTAQSFGPDIGKARGAADKIFKIIEYPSKIDAIAIDEEKDKIRIPDTEKLQGRIEFKDVWFRYPTRKQDFVLKGLSLVINPEENVALVGESGCGKSTFVNLLMRFYDIDHGEILLDGVNIKDYNLHDLRNAISLVMQEPIIFNYSIKENILYGKLDAKNTEINDSAIQANALEFIESNDLSKVDNSVPSLIKAMTDNKERFIGTGITEEEYITQLETL